MFKPQLATLFILSITALGQVFPEGDATDYLQKVEGDGTELFSAPEGATTSQLGKKCGSVDGAKLSCCHAATYEGRLENIRPLFPQPVWEFLPADETRAGVFDKCGQLSTFIDLPINQACVNNVVCCLGDEYGNNPKANAVCLELT